MADWYYARGGQQVGPVDYGKIVELAHSGGLTKDDLVWTSAMKDWTPAGEIEGLFSAAPAASPSVDPANPYATPPSAWSEAPADEPGARVQEIVPGSEPILVTACVKRAFDLTLRNFGVILLVGITYLVVTMAAGFLLGKVDQAMGWGAAAVPEFSPADFERARDADSPTGRFRSTFGNEESSLFSTIVSQVFSIFLSLGLARIGLNLVSGAAVSVGMLFGEGRKLLRALGATILFALMLVVGLLLLIVPGIYIALRFGQYLNAIVDRDLGILEALSYSSSITTNNRMNLFLLFLLSIGVFLAGLLALVVGLIVAYPVVWLSWMVAYRWMQYGHRAAMDQPGTQAPLLAGS